MVHGKEISEMKPITPEEVISPVTRVPVEQMLVALAIEGKDDSETERRVVDAYCYCFQNCFTVEEMVQHMTSLGYGIKEASVREAFKTFMKHIEPKEAVESYDRDSRRAADIRVVKDRQGEPSTSGRP